MTHVLIAVDDENAYYLIHLPGMQMIWPYDDRGRLHRFRRRFWTYEIEYDDVRHEAREHLEGIANG